MALYRSPDYQRSFESIGLSVQEEFNIDFQDGSHLGFPMRMILANFDHLDTSNEVCSPLAFWFRIKKFKTDFQHGCCGDHLGFPIRMILDIFDLQLTLIRPIKFRVIWPYCSSKVQNRFSSWQLWWP